MALTSLEAISQKLSEKRKTDLENILSISGSAAITKNDYGITIVDDTNVASSLLFKPLTKTKLDTEELVKAINVELTELKPNIPKPKLDLVPKPVYDAKVEEVNSLRIQVQDLNDEINSLNSQIDGLRGQLQNEINQRYVFEQLNTVLQNQITTLGATINEFASQIGVSLQKSVDESILRASLQSQNAGFKAQIEALIKQIDSLNAIIEGLQAQLGAVQQQQAIQQSTANAAAALGGDVVNDVVVSKFSPKDTVEGNTIRVRFKNNTGYTLFEWGNTLDLVNNDNSPVTITLTHTQPDGQNFLTIPETNFTMEAGSKKTIKLKANLAGCKYGSRDHSHEYDGTFVVNVKRADGSEKGKDYKTKVQIMHPSSF